ncbi:MAG: flagellin [Lachnospiraceae bacterium]
MTIKPINNSMDSYLASGKKINSAADNAAGLTIVEKMKSQSSGLDVGTSNAAAGKDLIATAAGALDSITDSLQRVRELSLQASNTAVYSSDDIGAMQDEVEQLMQGIQDVAKGTTFNNQTLLDGSRADYNLATNPSGGGLKIQMGNATLSSLGLEGYDLTGNFDINAIDKALQSVSDASSSLGAQSNALTSIMNYNTNTSLSTTASQSKLEDLDYAKAISQDQKNNILEEYQMMMQKKQEEQKAQESKNLLGL